jgi:hypothetical protein
MNNLLISGKTKIYSKFNFNLPAFVGNKICELLSQTITKKNSNITDCRARNSGGFDWFHFYRKKFVRHCGLPTTRDLVDYYRFKCLAIKSRSEKFIHCSQGLNAFAKGKYSEMYVYKYIPTHTKPTVQQSWSFWNRNVLLQAKRMYRTFMLLTISVCKTKLWTFPLMTYLRLDETITEFIHYEVWDR